MTRNHRRWLARTAGVGVLAAAAVAPLAMTPSALGATQAPASLCGPPADTVPPQVTSLSFSKTTVNLNSASRTVTITAHATDSSGHGVASSVKHLLVYGFRGTSALAMKRTTGTAADGTWTGTLTISKYGKPGTRRLNYVRVIDGAGNRNDYFNSVSVTSPNAVQLQSDWPATITVTGTPAKRPPRPTSGRLSAFSFSPTTVNTTKKTKILHVTAKVSGRQPKRIEVSFNSPNHRRHLTDVVITKHSGRTWTGHVRIDRGIGTRPFEPSISLDFGPGLRPIGRVYSPTQIESRFFHHRLHVISTRYVKSRATLKDLRITPQSIDTTTGAKQVTVKATLVDAKANIKGAYAVFAPVNNKSGDYASVGATLKYTSHHVWKGSATFAECVPSGTWDLGVYAYTPNRSVTHFAKPSRNGLPDSIQVTSTPGDIDPPTVTDSSASSAAETVSLTFSEGVKNVTSSDLSVYALTPPGSAYQNSETIGGIVCMNGASIVDCSGSGGLVTKAVLSVPSLSGHAGVECAVWANQHGVSTQLTDGVGNPMDWENPATVVMDS